MHDTPNHATFTGAASSTAQETEYLVIQEEASHNKDAAQGRPKTNMAAFATAGSRKIIRVSEESRQLAEKLLLGRDIIIFPSSNKAQTPKMTVAAASFSTAGSNKLI
jgi:2-keto-3-deoxy-L-rhamnonate aldolase RhmA